MKNLIIRKATPEDAAVALRFMEKLGAFQKMSDKITINEKKMKTLIQEKAGEAIFAVKEGHEIAFMYYYYNSSAFTGDKGIYIDGLYVEEEHRNTGVGTKMISYVSKLAQDRGCSRLEWVCLDWNKVALEYYDKLGAEKKEQLILHRLEVKE